MQILVTNDDGIHAPGLHALAEAMKRLGDVQVIAPASEQSGVGLGITYLHPLLVQEQKISGEHFGWAVAGTPADCVKLGILEFCAERPTLVVSGINPGPNVGINVLYSGTVAAAIEGAFFGVTSIAVSRSDDPSVDYTETAERAVSIVEQILETNPPQGSLWNVNFPPLATTPPRGTKVVTMGVRRHVQVVESRLDPRGRKYYWTGLDPLVNHEMEPGTDVKELSDGYITVTPLRFDLTHHELISDHPLPPEWCDSTTNVDR
ncbi:MAG: 5'/3'-nucleotidase SurE [Planctomycetota bacterium]|nr:5'/3'-nucleotidase SurE [Planctomycetota bacterium]